MGVELNKPFDDILRYIVLAARWWQNFECTAEEIEKYKNDQDAIVAENFVSACKNEDPDKIMDCLKACGLEKLQEYKEVYAESEDNGI